MKSYPKLLLALIFSLFLLACACSYDKPDKLDETTWECDDFDIKPFEYVTYTSRIQIETTFRLQRALHTIKVLELYDSFLDTTYIVEGGVYDFYASSGYTCEGKSLTLNFEEQRNIFSGETWTGTVNGNTMILNNIVGKTVEFRKIETVVQ